MGYQGHGSLTGNKKALVDPLIHTQGHDAWDTTGLGFGLEDNMLVSTQNTPISSELEDDDSLFVAATSQDEEFIPITSLLLGEETFTTNNDDEASTSRQLE